MFRWVAAVPGAGSCAPRLEAQKSCNACAPWSTEEVKVASDDPQDIKMNIHHNVSHPLVSRFGQGTALVLAAMTLAAPSAANAAAPPAFDCRQMVSSTASATEVSNLRPRTSGLDPIESVEVNTVEDDGELQVEVVAFDRAGKTIAHQSIVIADGGEFDVSGYYRIDGEWHSQFTSNMGGSKVANSELTQQEASTVQAQLELAIERTNDPQKGVIACGLGVVGSTGTCGGLAGIPGAGWFACSLAIAATVCACFEEETGC